MLLFILSTGLSSVFFSIILHEIEQWDRAFSLLILAVPGTVRAVMTKSGPLRG